MRLLILSVSVLISISLFSQKEFKEGYIITQSGDSLYGLIEVNNYAVNSKYCFFKETEDSKKITYVPNDIMGYRFIDGKYYISSEIEFQGDTVKAFLEYIIKGEISFYFIRIQESDHYYIQKKDGVLTHLDASEVYYDYDRINMEWVISEDKTIQKFHNTDKYKGILKYYLHETPELSNKVDDMTLSHKSLTKIAKDYHNAVCDDYECIVYENKTKPWVSFGVTQWYSFVKIKNFDPIIDEPFKSTQLHSPGIIFMVQLPGADEQIQLRFEYSKYKLNSEVIINNRGTVLKASGSIIPITIQYTKPLKNISLYGSGGIAFNSLTDIQFLLFSVIYDNKTNYTEPEQRKYEYSKLNYGISLSGGLTYSINNILFDLGIGFVKCAGYSNDMLKFNLSASYVFN
jgi:hypothetical protein